MVILAPMKTAISIPDELFVEGERAARRLGWTRSELYREALRRFLREEDSRSVTEALDAVYGAAPEASELDPVLARMQSTSLEPEEW